MDPSGHDNHKDDNGGRVIGEGNEGGEARGGAGGVEGKPLVLIKCQNVMDALQNGLPFTDQEMYGSGVKVDLSNETNPQLVTETVEKVARSRLKRVTLILNHQKLKTLQQMQRDTPLKRALIAANNVEELQLESNVLSYTVLGDLADVLNQNGSIRSLSLLGQGTPAKRSIDLMDERTREFIKPNWGRFLAALRGSGVESLNLSFNKIGPFPSQILAREYVNWQTAEETQHSLQRLSLKECGVDEVAAQHLARAVLGHPSLQAVDAAETDCAALRALSLVLSKGWHRRTDQGRPFYSALDAGEAVVKEVEALAERLESCHVTLRTRGERIARGKTARKEDAKEEDDDDEEEDDEEDDEDEEEMRRKRGLKYRWEMACKRVAEVGRAAREGLEGQQAQRERERQLNTAQENLRKAREEWDAKEAAYKKEVSDTQRQLRAVAAGNATMVRELTAAQEDRARAREDRDKAVAERAGELQSEMEEALKQREEARERAERAESARLQSEEELREERRRAAEMRSRLALVDQLQRRASAASEDAERAADLARHAEAKLAEAGAVVKDWEDRWNAENRKAKTLLSEKSKLSQQLLQIGQNGGDEAREAKAALENRVEELTAKVEELARKRDKYKRKRGEAEEEMQKARGELDGERARWATEAEKLKKEVAQHKKEADQHKVEAEKLKSAAAELRKAAELTSQELSSLKRELDGYKQSLIHNASANSAAEAGGGQLGKRKLGEGGGAGGEAAQELGTPPMVKVKTEREEGVVGSGGAGGAGDGDRMYSLEDVVVKREGWEREMRAVREAMEREKNRQLAPLKKMADKLLEVLAQDSEPIVDPSALVAWKTSDVYRGGAWDDRDRPLLPGERLVMSWEKGEKGAELQALKLEVQQHVTGSLSKTSWLRINREKNKTWLSIIDGKRRQRGETKPTTKAQLIEAFEVLDSRTQTGQAEYPQSGTAEVYVVSEDDEREALRGQYGVRAARKLDKGDFVGFYAGQLRHAAGGKLNAYDEFRRQTYYFECELENNSEYLPRHLQEKHIPDGKELDLIIDAYATGNQLMFINDYRLDPFKDPPSNEGEDRLNTAYIKVNWKGWPYVVVIAVKDIQKGEELLGDYSESYWNGQRSSKALWDSMHETFKNLLAMKGHMQQRSRRVEATSQVVISDSEL